MKNKKFVAVITAALLAIGTIFSLVACGGGDKGGDKGGDNLLKPTRDWSTAAWTDYDPVAYLTKNDVSFSCGKYDGSQTEGFASMISVNLMLYKDGSACEVSGFDKKGVFPIGSDIEAFDDNYIKYIAFGYWTKDGNTVTIKLKGLETTSYKDGAPSEDWQTYTGKLEGGVLTIADFKVEGGIECAIQSNQYKTMQEYLDDVPSAF